MIYREHKPANELAKYVRCYYSIEYSAQAVQGSHLVDYAFATGCVEVMFTLQGTFWETKANENFTKTSPVEVWGQILKPLMFRVTGDSKVFGIRFHPSAAALFLHADVSKLNDHVCDLTGVVGNSVKELHARLQDAASTEDRVLMMNRFLLKKIEQQSRSLSKIDLVHNVMNELSREDFFDNIENVANRYGITSRYLQKIFVQHTGLTPKLFSKINRFQNSLLLLRKEDLSLTDVAYTSGYFDQSHFIREFKSFTGFLPSGFRSVQL